MSEPLIYKAIVAMASNRVIGRDGQLPWHLPEDFKWFKKATMGRPIVMGRKTWESIGKPLPGRQNIVVSRTLAEAPYSTDLVSSVEALNELQLEGEVFVIGGAGLYEAMLPMCAEVLLSYVFEACEGDTVFPPFEEEFAAPEVVATFAEFEVRRYRRCD
jgi:dihydrofolate reductase